VEGRSATKTPTPGPDPAYRAEIERWRTAREGRLKADGGWLTVAGLFWLKEGANRFGADSSLDIELPKDSAPGRAGIFALAGRKVTLKLDRGVTATLDGKVLAPGETVEMKPDTSGSPSVLSLNRLTMHVIARGARFGIRLKDMDSSFRKDFKGLQWFPVDESMRVTARWVAFNPPKKIAIPNVLGQVENSPWPGEAVFTLAGTEVRLAPILEEPDAKELFFIFKDSTAAVETYGAGRFLYAEMPKDGKIVLDFNKAYSPPCAFTPYATCPLPPPQNVLTVRVEAGEKSPHH
jgi:uncharacterized protein